MIIKTIQKTPKLAKKQTDLLTVFLGQETSSLIPEEFEIWIDTDKIEMIAAPLCEELSGGCFTMKYAGETLYVKESCFQELLETWQKTKGL